MLSERLEIRVPADRAVKFKGPATTQTVNTEGAVRVYRWTYSKLQSTELETSDRKKVEAARGRGPAPDVQLSSFLTWADVGQVVLESAKRSH